MKQAPNKLPAAAEWVLTRRLPCALLAAIMFELALWFPGTIISVPLLVMNLLTPALFALITLGGGAGFATQVALLAAILASLAAKASLEPGLMLLMLYGLLPILAAVTLNRADGMSRSAQHLAIGLGTAMLATLIAGAASHDVPARAFMDQMLSPLFAATQQDVDAATLERIRSLIIWMFPGVVSLSLWVVWWGNVMVARNIAVRYSFYHGDRRPISGFRLDRRSGYLLMVLTAVGVLTQGTVQYLAVNAAILMAGLAAVQGLAVVHLWLQVRHMQMLIVLMYIMLLIQPVMVLPFTVVGLLDIWLDYRRNILPAGGGK